MWEMASLYMLLILNTIRFYFNSDYFVPIESSKLCTFVLKQVSEVFLLLHLVTLKTNFYDYNVMFKQNENAL